MGRAHRPIVPTTGRHAGKNRKSQRIHREDRTTVRGLDGMARCAADCATHLSRTVAREFSDQMTETGHSTEARQEILSSIRENPATSTRFDGQAVHPQTAQPRAKSNSEKGDRNET